MYIYIYIYPEASSKLSELTMDRDYIEQRTPAKYSIL